MTLISQNEEISEVVSSLSHATHRHEHDTTSTFSKREPYSSEQSLMSCFVPFEVQRQRCRLDDSVIVGVFEVGISMCVLRLRERILTRRFAAES